MAQAVSQRLPVSETHVLKMLSQGAPMVGVLNELCNFIDAKLPGAIATVLLPDGDGRLRLAAGPKVPKVWNEAFDDMKLHSYTSFLRMAGQEGPVPVADMRSDPSFAACWKLALSQGVQAAWSVPIFSKRKILGTLILFYPTPQPPGDPDFQLLEHVIHMAAIAIECHRNEEELREFSRRLCQSQDEERRRIARELHDGTGQELALLEIKLSQLKGVVTTSPEESEEILLECTSVTKSISDQLRTLSYLLHPPLLDECGLSAAIHCYVTGINQRNGLHVEVEMPHKLPRFTEEAELAIFRIVQASLTNVHLHSRATVAKVKNASCKSPESESHEQFVQKHSYLVTIINFISLPSLCVFISRSDESLAELTPKPVHPPESKVVPDYWLADTFDSFRGAFFCNTATKWRPDAGIWIFPPSTISLAVSFRPYTSAVASSSGRSVEPSSEMPAKRPRERE